MKRENINYVLVGVAVLAALGMLLFALLVLTGGGGATARYEVVYRNVTGLSYGAPVFYEGFRVGQVRGITPQRDAEGTRYRVELGIREDWPIPDDSVARLQSTGLLADVAIGISEGNSTAMLAEGGELAGREGADVFAAMNDLAGELTVLTRDRIRPLVDSLAGRIDSISALLDSSAPALLSETQALIGRLNRAADGVNQMLGEPNQQQISAILADVRAVSAQLDQTRARADELLLSLNATVDENRPELRQTVLDLESTMGTVSRRIDAIVHHLETSSRNFDEFTREIRRNPSRLIYTPPADDVEVR